MKLKTGSFVALIIGVLLFGIGLFPILLYCRQYTPQAGATAIIGGADQPTFSFMMSQLLHSWPFCLMLFGLSLGISALFCLLFSKTAAKNCSIKTSAVALGLSAVSALGMVSVILWYSIAAFHEMSQHPVAYPFSILVGSLCGLGCFALLILYGKARKRFWSLKGMWIDTLTAVLYFPAFFFTFLCLLDGTIKG